MSVSDKVSYRGKTSWDKEISFKEVDKILQERELPPREPDLDVGEVIGKFTDLIKKTNKISKALDGGLINTGIPVDAEKNPEVYEAVKRLDPDSKGLRVSYSFYKKIINTMQQLSENIRVDDLADSLGSGLLGTSEAIRKKILGKNSTTSPKREGLES